MAIDPRDRTTTEARAGITSGGRVRTILIVSIALTIVCFIAAYFLFMR